MSRVTVRDIGWSQIKADSAKLTSYVLEFGLFEDAGEHDGIPFAQIGFWQEYGTVDIPARPWLSGGARFTERAAMRQITSIVNRIGKLPNNPEQLLKPLAKAIARGIQDYALNGPFVPNAESTEKQKGFNLSLIHI